MPDQTMNVYYIFGNGNISWADFQSLYAGQLLALAADPAHAFIVGDFRGVDTLALELLKTLTPRVSLYHVGERPRYMPDAFRTQVTHWTVVGGFASDAERDRAAITACTHFLAIDFNSDAKRTSGTQKNIVRCLELGKVRV